MHREPSVIRFTTYNVHQCVGRDGVHAPARVASVISEIDADVVALQEFSYPVDIALETRTPVVLTQLDTYECALGPTRRRGETHWFGNVLLTRHAIKEVHRVDLSVEWREPRGALAATINIRGTELHVLATHLGLRLSERRFQVKQIMNYLDSLQGECIVVLGDFNDWLPGRSVVHMLDERLGKSPRPRSFPVGRPLLSLDRVWVHPHQALRRVFIHRSATAKIASDHFPVVADIDVGTGATVAPAAREPSRSYSKPSGR